MSKEQSDKVAAIHREQKQLCSWFYHMMGDYQSNKKTDMELWADLEHFISVFSSLKSKKELELFLDKCNRQ